MILISLLNNSDVPVLTVFFKIEFPAYTMIETEYNIIVSI